MMLFGLAFERGRVRGRDPSAIMPLILGTLRTGVDYRRVGLACRGISAVLRTKPALTLAGDERRCRHSQRLAGSFLGHFRGLDKEISAWLQHASGAYPGAAIRRSQTRALTRPGNGFCGRPNRSPSTTALARCS